MILALRTDKPEAEFYICDTEGPVVTYTWRAHRELSDNLLATIQQQLIEHRVNWMDIEGMIVFQGPGSFTGLRIGITVANALCDTLSVPLVGVQGDDWINRGLKRLNKEDYDDIVLPFYGAPARITSPKK